MYARSLPNIQYACFLFRFRKFNLHHELVFFFYKPMTVSQGDINEGYSCRPLLPFLSRLITSRCCVGGEGIAAATQVRKEENHQYCICRFPHAACSLSQKGNYLTLWPFVPDVVSIPTRLSSGVLLLWCNLKKVHLWHNNNSTSTTSFSFIIQKY